MSRGLYLTAILLASQAGCKDRNERSGPMPQPSKAVPAGFDVDTGKRVQLPEEEEDAIKPPTGPKAKKGAATIKSTFSLPNEALIQLKKSIPELEKMRVLEGLQVVPNSRLARMVLCLEQSVAESSSQILRAYRLGEWNQITVHTPPHDENRRSFTANSDRFRVNGSAYQGDFKDCEKDKGYTRVSLSFQERQPTGSIQAPESNTSETSRSKAEEARSKAARTKAGALAEPAPRFPAGLRKNSSPAAPKDVR